MLVENIFIELILFSYGLIFGSFINALVWRLKNKLNWLNGRSQCSLCGHRLSPIDLIPVISWILLRGRCRYCNKRIKDNPLVELLTGIVFVLSYTFWPYNFDTLGKIKFIIWLLTTVLLIAIFVYDLKWMIIPNKLLVFFLILSFFQLIEYLSHNLSIYKIFLIFCSILLGGGLFNAIYYFSKGKMIGGGDVKLGYVYGLFLLSPILSWQVLIFASFIGTIYSVPLILFKKYSLKTKVPFGPFLIIGIFISYIFGDKIFHLVNLYV